MKIKISLIFLKCLIKTNGLASPYWDTGGPFVAGQRLMCCHKCRKNAINCVVTSPPYFWLRDYGVDGQIGMEDSVDEYVRVITIIMNEVRRVLREDGVVFFNVGDTFYSGKGKSHGQDEKSKKRRFGSASGRQKWRPRNRITKKVPHRYSLAVSNKFYGIGLGATQFDYLASVESLYQSTLQDRPGRSYEHVFLLAKGT